MMSAAGPMNETAATQKTDVLKGSVLGRGILPKYLGKLFLNKIAYYTLEVASTLDASG